ncbi:MAG: hypothetical protein Q7J16_02675, partial [Candidatus Cloacimonadales bacterium]|nr:hypothetical protein [Candidatus Cloacimonadales bacterium]
MSKKAKLKIMLILIIFVLFSLLHSQQTIIDTVYSIPELDGDFLYEPDGITGSICTWTYAMLVGDTGIYWLPPMNLIPVSDHSCLSNYL